MNIYYNPLNPACKNIIGGIGRGEELSLNVFLLKDNSKNNNRSGSTVNNTANNFSIEMPFEQDCMPPKEENKAFFSIRKDSCEDREIFSMQPTSFGWHISLKINETGLFFYSFSIDHDYICLGKEYKGTISDHLSSEFQLTVYSETYKTPDWFKGGIMYQIFPDRFCRVSEERTMPDIKNRILRSDWGGIPSYHPNEQGKILNNDFFGGNFKGIESKLPYLKSLNVTVIYLNPIFEAASNHRYDTSDYMNVDPVLGSKEDFKKLVDEAKKYGIRIILDGVFNHTGDDSVYFNKYGNYPTVGAYQSKQSPYYNWYTFQEYPDKYSSWWGIDILPEINEQSEEYQNFIFGDEGVLKTWLSYDIGGYRLDVADELPDFFLKKLREVVKEGNPNALIIGEVWEDASNKTAYSKRREYLQGYELDSVMNYPLKDAIINFAITGNVAVLTNTVRMLRDHYPKQTLDVLMNILGTHDTSRILTVLSEKKCYTKEEMASPNMLLTDEEKIKAIEKVKMAALLQYTMCGIPCVYYGDENAAEGYIDPFCRKCFDWQHINEDMLSYYRLLGNIRTHFNNIFKDGDFEEVFIENGCYLFRRSKKGESIYIFANNSSERYYTNFKGKYREYLNGKDFTDQLEIQPFAYGIFKQVA